MAQSHFAIKADFFDEQNIGRKTRLTIILIHLRFEDLQIHEDLQVRERVFQEGERTVSNLHVRGIFSAKKSRRILPFPRPDYV